MSASYRKDVRGMMFYSANTTYAIPPYQCVSLASAAEVAALNALGHPGKVGEVVVPTPISSGAPTRRVYGVTLNGGFVGEQLEVIADGVAKVQVGAAVALDSLLFPATAENRTQVQTPFTNNFDMQVKVDSRVAPTYELVLADDVAITPASSGANAIYYPLGFALEVATAKYDIIDVDLKTGLIYA